MVTLLGRRHSQPLPESSNPGESSSSDYTRLLEDDPESLNTLDTLRSSSFTEYTLSHAPNSLYTDYLIISSNLPSYEPLYHLESSVWTNRPDLIMRERSKDGPIAEVVSFRRSKGSYWVHVGRDGDKKNKIWKEVFGARKLTKTSEKWWKMDKYELQVPYEPTVGSEEENPSTKTILFQYAKTPSTDSSTKQSKLAPENWKILDGDTGTVIGFLYDRRAVGSHKGRLILSEAAFVDVKREWVLLSIMGMIERRRRS